MRAAGPDLATIDQPTAVGLGRAGRGREDVRARVGLAEADAEAQLAASDLRQDFLPDLLLAVAQDDRAALPIGGRVCAGRCTRRQHLLRHHIALEMRALVAAVLLRPGHADPALSPDSAAELARERPLAVARDKGPGLCLLAQNRPDLLAQFFGLGRQFDRVETEAQIHYCLAVPVSLRALGNKGPELVGAMCGDHPPEALGPQCLVAELFAPCPQPPRRMMQRMLVGEAHRTMHLVGNGSAGAGRLATAYLGDRHLGEADLRL